jgi:hypothetical protein
MTSVVLTRVENDAKAFRQEVHIRQIRACKDVQKLQDLAIVLMQRADAAHEMLRQQMQQKLSQAPVVQVAEMLPPPQRPRGADVL